MNLTYGKWMVTRNAEENSDTERILARLVREREEEIQRLKIENRELKAELRRNDVHPDDAPGSYFKSY